MLRLVEHFAIFLKHLFPLPADQLLTLPQQTMLIILIFHSLFHLQFLLPSLLLANLHLQFLLISQTGLCLHLINDFRLLRNVRMALAGLTSPHELSRGLDHINDVFVMFPLVLELLFFLSLFFIGTFFHLLLELATVLFLCI